MTRHRELELDSRVRRLNPLIAETMQHVAHVPIRNRGTVVGSLCHADPSAEMPLLFVLLDGTITAIGPDGTRESRPRIFSNPSSLRAVAKMKSSSKHAFRSCPMGRVLLLTK